MLHEFMVARYFSKTIDVKALCVKSHSYCKSREFVQIKCMTENIQDRCNITLQVISKVSTIVITPLFYYSIIVFSPWNRFPIVLSGKA